MLSIPKDTQAVYSYWESRKGGISNTLFFGLQYYLRRYLEGVVVTDQKIDEAKEFFKEHLGQDIMNEAMWRYIAKELNGELPIRIRAVPEGLVVNYDNALMTIENTDDKCAPLVNYLETLLSKLWYPCTVASRSLRMRSMILDSLEKTGDPSLIDYKLHDFGDRGSTSVESAALGGAAHLVNFKGSDTMVANMLLKHYYSISMASNSVPAAEHSTITSWGKQNELAAYENMLDQYPTGIVSIVIDSYNPMKAIDMICTKLKDKIINRKGVVVLRPDSGVPSESVSNCMARIFSHFHATQNSKGYWVLPSFIRILQGDGIDEKSLGDVLKTMEHAKWSTDNVTFGSGGGLLQKDINRDTHRFAFKCSAIKRNGIWEDVQKKPDSDPSKASKAGRFELYFDDLNGLYYTSTIHEHGKPEGTQYLSTVFENSLLSCVQSFGNIRARTKHAAKHLVLK